MAAFLGFYALWAVLLILQNGAHTLTSRARNSRSLWYNGVASIFSNGVWFLSQVLVIDDVTRRLRTGDWLGLTFTGLFYVAFTIVGSVGAHALAMKWEDRRPA